MRSLVKRKLQRLITFFVFAVLPVVALSFLLTPQSRLAVYGAPLTVSPPAPLTTYAPVVRINLKRQMGPLDKNATFKSEYFVLGGGDPTVMGCYVQNTMTKGAPNFISGRLNYLYYDGAGKWIVGTSLGEPYHYSSSSIHYYATGTADAVPTGTYTAQSGYEPNASINRH